METTDQNPMDLPFGGNLLIDKTPIKSCFVSLHGVNYFVEYATSRVLQWRIAFAFHNMLENYFVVNLKGKGKEKGGGGCYQLRIFLWSNLNSGAYPYAILSPVV